MAGCDCGVAGFGWSEPLLVSPMSFGKELDLSLWQPMSAGRGTAEATDVASQIDLSTPFYLPAGTYGFAVAANNFTYRYTVGANSYTNGVITIDTGAATNSLMGPAVFSPRSANVTFKYRRATDNTSVSPMLTAPPWIWPARVFAEVFGRLRSDAASSQLLNCTGRMGT